jgi:hypothetical protein
VPGCCPKLRSDDLNLVSCVIYKLEHLLFVRNFMDRPVGIQLFGKSSAKDLISYMLALVTMPPYN